jgi:hypothetical protein
MMTSSAVVNEVNAQRPPCGRHRRRRRRRHLLQETDTWRRMIFVELEMSVQCCRAFDVCADLHWPHQAINTAALEIMRDAGGSVLTHSYCPH